ncbi:MAG TPA: bifunctional diaminohydroxyphosphoribosylaminopyrimidine deaminase/5-amino-6-(5-phosphoribosylamino)uracil reductase RibD [Polyangia bacterium]|nr:bifunctional diaminohydroxyphosphoribosylaminopyrimidine deaminase/5-amino-6-(5-phosphoribosylamino)uracil reductase RibD [Polyangia bacterium]
MKEHRFSAGDDQFMRRALALAERGRGRTRPNPVVGAVIVRGGRVLAEGFHRRAGEAHGEVDALSRLGGRAPGATLYVNLEPCCHTGRTGPCTSALIAAGLRRVVVGCLDPNPRVDGRGVRRLRAAGIRVDVGCLQDVCRETNRAFFVWVRERRPLVTLKVAATLDGFIAGVGGAPAWITGNQARAAAHALRAAHDAVLVGAGTVRADDPRLTVRLPARRVARARRGQPAQLAPARVVLDGRLSTAPGARVLRAEPGLPATLVLGARGAESRRVRALQRAGAEVALLPARRDGRLSIARVLAELGRRDIQSVLVEGGAGVHGAFIDARLIDRVAVFLAPKLIGAGVAIAAGAGWPVPHALGLGPLSVEAVGPDLLVRGEVIRDAPGRH